MDLGARLRSLGLEEYEAAFRQNHIDDSVLPSLTAEDLKDLGIGSIGHRRKLLDAIALLRAEPTPKAPPPEAPATLPRPAQDAAERRYHVQHAPRGQRRCCRPLAQGGLNNKAELPSMPELTPTRCHLRFARIIEIKTQL